MKYTALPLTLAAISALSISACSNAGADNSGQSSSTVAQGNNKIIGQLQGDTEPGPNISEISSGSYSIDPGHSYVAFSYLHSGYSYPILRWGKIDATVELDSNNPENSKLSVSIPVDSIDSGVVAWDKKLVTSEWFDAESHPVITFKSTDLDEVIQGRGTLIGDLTLKGITKSIMLDVKLNGVGQHFRSKKDMFGISATGSMKRGDFGVDTYLPRSNDITLQIEAEFIKVDE